MLSTNEINKIKIKSPLTVKKVNMSTLLFNNNLAVSKNNYSIVDEFLNILEPAEDNLTLYQNTNSAKYFEYNVPLINSNTIISGQDRFGSTPTDLLNKTVIVFINGYKLLPGDFILTDSTITIVNKYPSESTNTIIIYCAASIVYKDQVIKDSTWDFTTRSITIPNFIPTHYAFFNNGALIPANKISVMGDKVSFNIQLRTTDIIDYYRFPGDTIRLFFAETPGYFSYGPKDDYGSNVPTLFDAYVSVHTHIIRLAIDDVRPGFFIKEENGDGCLMIISDDYETYTVKCIQISPFSKETYAEEEYYLQVPEARSILHYISEYDLNGKLFPEILGIFQRTLLDETYDSLQRLKNIRSINKVDSSHINLLINFLGMNINITNMTLEEKHALLEELNNFHDVVGTKTSYNFYNVTATNSRIMKIDQLFTPIKDISDDPSDPIQRYVTFRTAEELGAIIHREYVYPVNDYGEIGTLANSTDSLSNTPNDPGVLTDPDRPAIINNTRIVYTNNEDGTTTPVIVTVTPNPYLVEPTPGPNLPTIDYGWIENDAENFYDYGLITDEIIGKWIEWMEWNRPTNWYPTNHVDISVEVPAEIDYNTFMTEFKKTFYDIASTVLYIHSVIQVYTFGNENQWEAGEPVNFGIMTAPVYHSIEWAFTNDPARQAEVPPQI